MRSRDITTLPAQLSTMQELLFEPLGITRARRILGLKQHRDTANGIYEIQAHMPIPDVALSDEGVPTKWVPAQYSSNWDQGPAAGGWLMSMVDLARIGAALTYWSDDLLSAKSQRIMMWKSSPPVPLDPAGDARHGFFNYGNPMTVPGPGGSALLAVGHNGAVLGGEAVLGVRVDGLVIALAVNGQAFSGYDQNDVYRWPAWGLGVGQFRELNMIANGVTKWPDVDLFDEAFGLRPVKARPFNIL
jgi:hypothetical protein